MPSFWKVKFYHWLYSPCRECLIVLRAALTKRLPISIILDLRAQTVRGSEDQPQWSQPTAGGRWRNSVFTHFKSAVTT